MSRKIDTAWFHEQIRQSKYPSLRKLAAKIKNRAGRPLDVSSLSLMLRGEREFFYPEAVQIADVLHLSLDEVLARAGYKTKGEVPLMGTIDADGRIKEYGDKHETVPSFKELPPNAFALRFKTSRSRLSCYNGWIIYAAPPAPMGQKQQPCSAVVKPKGHVSMVSYVERGFKPGTATLLGGIFDLEHNFDDVAIEWIAPILLIVPYL